MKRPLVWIAVATVVVLLAGFATLAGIKSEADGGYALSKIREWRRDVQDVQLAAALQSVPCPASAFVIAALGQSNAGNHLGPKVARDPSLPVFAFFRDRCVHLEDPISGATGEDGSLWTELAHRLARQRGEPVVVIAGATAGSSVRDWDKDYAGMTSRASRSIAGAVRAGLTPQVVIWLQGESDGETRMRQATYAAHLENVATRINAGIAKEVRATGKTATPAWIITQTSRCWGAETRSEDVRGAQRAAAVKIPNAHLGPDTDALDDTFRRDGCHFGERGRARIAGELAALIPKVLR